MPSPSIFDSISAEDRRHIEHELIRRNFKDYDGLTVWLQELGFEVKRSSVHRFGSKIQKRLQKVRDSTDAARLIADAAPDDNDSRSAAVISLVQSELFEVMVALQDLDEAAPEARVGLLKDAARAVMDMTKASVLNKKWKQYFEAQVRKIALAEAANQAGATAKAAGVSADTIERIRRDVLGMAT